MSNSNQEQDGLYHFLNDDAQGWELAHGNDWRQAAEFVRHCCPAELQIAAAARLAAMATLWSEAEQAVRSQKPGTTQELQECLRPLVLAYVEHIFDAAAEPNPGVARALIPAVLRDGCGPMYGQISLTIWCVAESLGKEQFTGKMAEMEQTRCLLWRSVAGETLPGPITQNLGKYVRTSLETRAAQFEARRTPASKDTPQRKDAALTLSPDAARKTAKASTAPKPAMSRGRPADEKRNRQIAAIIQRSGPDWKQQTESIAKCLDESEQIDFVATKKWHEKHCETWANVETEDREGFIKALQHCLQWASLHPD